MSLGAVALIVFALCGCDRSATSGEVVALAAGHASEGVHLPKGIIASVKIGLLCTTGDPAKILDIRPSAPDGGLKVIYWAIQPNEFQTDPTGEHIGDVTGARFPVVAGQVTAPHAIVTTRCPENPTDAAGNIVLPSGSIASQVLVTVERTSDRTGSTPDFVVDFDTGSGTGTATIPHGLSICAMDDRTTSGCWMPQPDPSANSTSG